MSKTVAVYGSSMVAADAEDYIASYHVGQALATAGYRVMTGGYLGVMEAASKGAAEAGGHVIGVTTEVFSKGRGDAGSINPYVTKEIRYLTLRERLLHLVIDADAYVAMPGGLGTLHELITVWEFSRVGDIPTKPIICYGDYWATMLEPLRHTPYAKPYIWDLLTFVHSPEAVVASLSGAFDEERQSV